MLVYGWTFMGQRCSSYDYTMGFGVSARVAQKSTRLSVTPPHIYSIKSNSYLSILKYLCYFCADKSNQKPLGCSPSGQTSRWHEAAAERRGLW